MPATGERPFRLAVLGRPEQLERLARLPIFQPSQPAPDRPAAPLVLAGLVSSEPDGLPALPESEGEPPFCFPSLDAFLAATSSSPDPRADMLLDLRDDAAAFESLRRAAPSSLLLGDSRLARLLEGLLGGETLRRGWRDELSETRAILHALFEQTEDEILLLDAADPRTPVLDANRHACARRGLTQEDVRGRSYFDLPDRRPACATEWGVVPCPVRRALESGKTSEAQISRVEADGHLRVQRVVAYPVLGEEGGRPRHVIEVRRDITETLDMQRRLQQTERLAAIGELATYIAHEIRNPLFALAGFANALLRSPSLDEAARQKAGIILDEARRLDAILKNTLNFARPLPTPAPGQEPTLAVDCNRLAREMADLFLLAMREQGVVARLELAADLPLARADGELIKQCAINLVKNAMEALESRGGGTITLRTALEQEMVCLEVQDDGPGIPEPLLRQVFNPFFSTKNQGSGLGLAMTRKIVEDLGGQVRLRSVEGQGVRAAILLPPATAP